MRRQLLPQWARKHQALRTEAQCGSASCLSGDRASVVRRIRTKNEHLHGPATDQETSSPPPDARARRQTARPFRWLRQRGTEPHSAAAAGAPSCRSTAATGTRLWGRRYCTAASPPLLRPASGGSARARSGAMLAAERRWSPRPPAGAGRPSSAGSMSALPPQPPAAAGMDRSQEGRRLCGAREAVQGAGAAAAASGGGSKQRRRKPWPPRQELTAPKSQRRAHQTDGVAPGDARLPARRLGAPKQAHCAPAGRNKTRMVCRRVRRPVPRRQPHPLPPLCLAALPPQRLSHGSAEQFCVAQGWESLRG